MERGNLHGSKKTFFPRKFSKKNSHYVKQALTLNIL